MRDRFSRSMITLAIAAAAAGAIISVSITRTSAQAQKASATVPTASAKSSATAPALKTPWGEPDLQGIWTDESDTPLQRSPKYANQEFFTEAQRAELDKERAALIGRDRRVERGTELDVAGAYNAQFMSVKHTGARTSLIVDPPNGRIPPLTPEAQKMAAGDREFRLALLQATQTCKNKSVGCAGGKYDPTPSPRFAEPPPRYNTARMNRRNNPEDGALPDRCLTGGLARIRRRDRQFPPHCADGRRHLDVLRRRSGTGLAAKYRYERKPAFAGQYSPVVRGFARSLGRQHTRNRRHELQLQRPITRVRGKICTCWSAGRAPGRTHSNTSSLSKIQPCGRGHGR